MKQSHVRAVKVLRGIAIFASLGFIFLGVSRGEATTVLQKAVYICLECIGVG